ncbi:MAG TPA: ABC transporter substrate-binding protein [Mycobacteriales bacterium]|nr:ABC transporter substrate-binding protein [Mycobacteriales bacterium]
MISTISPLAPLQRRIDEEFARIASELTRRGFLAGAAGTALLAGLAACGDGGSPSAAVPTTRTIDTGRGRVTVPADPRRVVCIDYFTAVFLIELGLTPVGGIDYSWVDRTTMFPSYVAPLKALPDIGEITSTNIEKVVDLHPDLILGPTPGSRYDNSKGAMGKLGSVAPVASVDFGKSGDWRGPFAQTANIVNRQQQLAPLLASYRDAVKKTKETYRGLLARIVVSVVDYAQSGQYAVDLPRSGNGVVLADLGVRFGKASVDDGTNSRELSFERVDALADSDLILYRADADGKPTSGLADVFALPSWKSLPAVRAGHVYPIGWADLCTYRWAELAIRDLSSIFDRYQGVV